MKMVMNHPYRIAALVEELSSLEREALILADKLQETQLKQRLNKFPIRAQAIKDNEKSIVDLLKKSGFKRSFHCHAADPHLDFKYCDSYFLRDTSVVVVRLQTWDSGIVWHGQYRELCMESELYVIPTGKKILDEIKEEMPWYTIFDYFFVELRPEAKRYKERINTLRQKALKTPTDSLLYIARNA